jgi:hypothetical protein
MTDPQQVLARLNFGRVDGESDNRFEHCFIGTEMLRQVLLPQHSLVVGNKGSGKSAICRLLCDDLQKVKPLLPKQFEEIFCIPAYGLQSEESLPGVQLRELNPETVDEFRYFWLLYLGLKVASTMLENPRMRALMAKTKNEKVKAARLTLERLLADVGLTERKGIMGLLRRRNGNGRASARSDQGERHLGAEFKQRTGVSIIALLENIDILLRETNCLVWIMLDKLDLLYVDDIHKLRASITGLVQLLVQYGNTFKNIQFKIFLRNDIYRQLHIVNKSHLISYTTEMKWRGPLLMKLLVARAVVDVHVRSYCEEVLGEKVDVTGVVLGSDDFVRKVFYAIFEPTTGSGTLQEIESATTHQWILKRLVDGTGSSFPRELIHLGNKAVEQQREYDRLVGEHTSSRLVSMRALKEAFTAISLYRCDTYLYSEFPHLQKHFDVFRGSESAVFHREELYMLFEPLNPKGDEAIRAVFDAGLLEPMGNSVDSARKFKVPLLYRAGLSITDKRRQPGHPKKHSFPDRGIIKFHPMRAAASPGVSQEDAAVEDELDD